MTEQQVIASQIPVRQIHPDPTQPRQLLPTDLAKTLTRGTPPADVITQLRECARHDPWTRALVEALDGLADSIAADGLIQPIRIIQDGEETYRIEEGERRWWAHHILVQRGDARFETITAFVIQPQTNDPGILRRRVAENLHRAGFTAIELSKAMAQRAQEIAAAEPTLSRREIDKRVGKENGMSDRRVRQFLALLTLSPEVQELAQQARLSESVLRSLVGIKDATRQLAKVRELIYPSRRTRAFAKRPRAGENASARVRPRKRQPVARARKPKVARSTVTRRLGLRKDLHKVVRRNRDEGLAGWLRSAVALAKEMQSTSLDDLGKQNWATIFTSPTDLRAVRTLSELLDFAESLAGETIKLQGRPARK